MKRNAYSQNRSLKAVSFILISVALIPLGGCLSNTARGAGDVFHGLGMFISGVGQDVSLMADGGDNETARRVNETGSARFGNGTNVSNASWTGRNN